MNYLLASALRHLCDPIFERFFLLLDRLIFAIIITSNGTDWQNDLIEATLIILEHIFGYVYVLN